MASCKECIHERVCVIKAFPDAFENTEWSKEPCDHFESKSEGEWIGEADGYADGELVYDVWNCSECNYCIDDGTDDADLLPNYCPNCGAKMKGE